MIYSLQTRLRCFAFALVYLGSERVGRLEESVEILIRLFSGEPVTYAGRFYQLADAVCRPVPAQRPRPHLVIGGARRRLLSVAARHADTVSLTFSGPGGFEVDASEERTLQKIEWIRRAASDRSAALEIEALVNVRFGPSRAAAAAEGSAKSGVPSDWLLRSPHPLFRRWPRRSRSGGSASVSSTSASGRAARWSGSARS